MRWTDKPRKKTRREIVLEYFKFMRIMGLYPKLVRYMFYLGKHHNKVCHNKLMIEFFVSELRGCRKIDYYTFKRRFIEYPLYYGRGVIYRSEDYDKTYTLTDLLMSYFKEKKIYNCIIVD